MRAAILAELRRPLVLDEVDLPAALNVGQVLVKVHFSGVCGSQLGEIDGAKGEDKHLPHLLGHEGSGTVIAVGPGVRHVSEGETVVLHWRKGAGIEASPPEYRWRGARVNAGWVTTFNEYAVVSENRLTPVPSTIDRRIAALFGCAVTTGFGVIENNVQLRIGESVVVFGAGGIGLNIVQAAALVSAYPIIAVDLFENKLALAKRLGATHIINNSTSDARTKILEITENDGVDAFVDNTGIPHVIELGYSLTKPHGRVTLVGVPHGDSKISIYSLPLHFGKRLAGSHGGESVPHLDIPRYLRLVLSGRIDLDSLVSDIVPLSDINVAIDAVRSGRAAGRCLIDLEH